MPRRRSSAQSSVSSTKPAHARLADAARPVAQAEGAASVHIDPREERLFRALDDDNDEVLLPRHFERVLAEIGLGAHDHRLRESMTALEGHVAENRPSEADSPW